MAYDLLADVTPVPGDCGELCGKVCCEGVEKHAGMYLFPGEECMFSGNEDWVSFESHPVAERVFCPEWTGRIEAVTFAVCRAVCPREARPLACRLFPLAAAVLPPPAQPGGAAGAESGTHTEGAPEDRRGPRLQGAPRRPRIRAMLDPDAALLCPLARYGRTEQLQPKFVAACRRVFGLLAADPLILADFRWRNARWREEGRGPWRKLLEP